MPYGRDRRNSIIPSTQSVKYNPDLQEICEDENLPFDAMGIVIETVSPSIGADLSVSYRLRRHRFNISPSRVYRRSSTTAQDDEHHVLSGNGILALIFSGGILGFFCFYSCLFNGLRCYY